MTIQSKWLWMGGGVAAVAALALGVPLVKVLIVATALACPLAMYFGMHGMGMGGTADMRGCAGTRRTVFLKRELASARDSRTANGEETRKEGGVRVHLRKANIVVTGSHSLGGSAVVRRHASHGDRVSFDREELPRP
jgi:hypothetical protein